MTRSEPQLELSYEMEDEFESMAQRKLEKYIGLINSEDEEE